ncbi:hypothetical protein [Cytobacillus purgationiresistens]|uniref:Uncharacterized protein n=1 Tax=Cytobacillus purgationiresistens TaxID=863449 RepID=A0ABU0ALM4_9BACI|nr:hypothetical protein [Cytobacillus purgationiresistens]MDQ0271641.1 hypothetical protein [Cytobacillus purgationiresistens]
MGYQGDRGSSLLLGSDQFRVHGAYMAQGANLPSFPNHDAHNQEGISLLQHLSVDEVIDSFVSTRQDLPEALSNVDADYRFTIGTGKRKFSRDSFVKIFLMTHITLSKL